MTLRKFHNPNYTGSLPEAVGDRYYGQDLMRDFNYLRGRAGQIPLDMPGGFTLPNSNVILTHGTVTHGANPATQIDIEQIIAYVKKDVTIPNNWATLPPGITTDDIAVRLEMPAQSDTLVASLGMTLDGTTHFLKLKYAEIDIVNSSRGRAKKAGTYISERQESYILYIDKVAVIKDEIEICRLAGDGIADLTITHLGGARAKTIGSLDHSAVCPDVLSVNGSFSMSNNDIYSVYFFDGGIIGTLALIQLPSPINLKGRRILLKYIGLGANARFITIDEFGEALVLAWFGKNGDTVEILSDGTKWILTHEFFVPSDTGWIARSSWANSWMGSVNLTLTGLAGVPIIGETVVETVTNTYGTLVAINGGNYIINEMRGASFITGGAGQFTSGNAVVFQTSGATATVGANTKNVSTPFFHGWPSLHSQLTWDFLIAPQSGPVGLGAPTIRIEAGNHGSNNVGLTVFGDALGHLRAESYVQLGSSVSAAFAWVAKGTGTTTGIGTLDYHYRVIASFKGASARKIL